jgi:hypothetical protein
MPPFGKIDGNPYFGPGLGEVRMLLKNRKLQSTVSGTFDNLGEGVPQGVCILVVLDATDTWPAKT